MSAFSQMPKIPFYKLMASSVDLASVFKIAVDAFNAQDLATLMNLCDGNVVIMAAHRHEPLCGKQAVAAFLAEQFQVNKPRFTPSSTSTTINSNGTIGHIIGTAEWNDRNSDNARGARIDVTVRFAFNFISQGNGWLISTLWGSID